VWEKVSRLSSIMEVKIPEGEQTSHNAVIACFGSMK
jgi:hypothetical protein